MVQWGRVPAPMSDNLSLRPRTRTAEEAKPRIQWHAFPLHPTGNNLKPVSVTSATLHWSSLLGHCVSV